MHVWLTLSTCVVHVWLARGSYLAHTWTPHLALGVWTTKPPGLSCFLRLGSHGCKAYPWGPFLHSWVKWLRGWHLPLIICQMSISWGFLSAVLLKLHVLLRLTWVHAHASSLPNTKYAYTYINRCTHHRAGDKEEMERGGMGKRLGLTFWTLRCMCTHWETVQCLEIGRSIDLEKYLFCKSTLMWCSIILWYSYFCVIYLLAHAGLQSHSSCSVVHEQVF